MIFAMIALAIGGCCSVGGPMPAWAGERSSACLCCQAHELLHACRLQSAVDDLGMLVFGLPKPMLRRRCRPGFAWAVLDGHGFRHWHD